jgi:hypothetical protein
MCWSLGFPEVRKAIMSLSWKLLPFAALAVLGAFALLPGGAARPDIARADYDCDVGEHRLRIDIVDDDEDEDMVLTAGAEVVIEPDPDGTGSSRTIADNGDGDASSEIGRIQFDDACETTEDDVYTITLEELPTGYDCDIVDDELETELTSNITVTFHVEDCDVATVVPTTGAAATVVAQASPSTVNCNGTSIVTIQVKGANGQPVAVGTNVTIQASIGSVSPSSGQTTSADGSVFVFYTAPSNAGGAATITARAGNAQGTATVTVNCAAPAPTTAPPPPTVSPGVITPPSTGDAGIGSDRTDWTPFAGIAVIVATLIGGAVAAVKTRE